jgi:glycerol-3-phosphate O-acyltransferase
MGFHTMIRKYWRRFRFKTRSWTDRALDGTHDHFGCMLPAQTGWRFGIIRRLFFSGIKLHKEQTDVIRRLPDDAAIVYVSKYHSNFEQLFYHTRYTQENLPVPELGLEYRMMMWQPLRRLLCILLAKIDHLIQYRSLPSIYKSGYIRKELLSGRAAALFLIGKKGFYKRFVKAKPDPLSHLIEIQKNSPRPIYLVPQLMCFGTKPQRSVPSMLDILFGSDQRPGFLRRWATLFRTPEKILVEISEPVDLRKFVGRAENRERSIVQQANALRRELVAGINRHRQSIIGPTLKSRQELIEDILTRDRVRDFMRQQSENTDTPRHQVHKKANDYLDEIASRYSIRVIRALETILRWIFNVMYDGVSIDQAGLQRLKNMSRKAPVIIIPSHKSHIDYLILSYLFHQNNMPCPHIAAGKNLSFWPMGPIFRGGGAFFLRRTFKGNPLYARIFAEYIHKLLEEGFNIEFFIEGGRSRTGKMILPKLGLLSIIINAFKNGACDDLIIAPIYIGYDRVLEESAYLNELEGGKKDPESLKQMIQARKFLKKRYGRIYIRFDEPISFKQLLARTDTAMEALSNVEQAALCRNLGYRVINAINKVSVVTPHAVVAGAFLNTSKKRVSIEDLQFLLDTYMGYLLNQKVALSDTLVMDPTGAMHQVLEAYVNRKFIERIYLGPEKNPETAVYAVVEGKRTNLEYYKNNCIAYFVPAAITALAILEKDAFQFSTTDLHDTYLFIRDLFKYEFAYDVDRPPAYFVRKNIKAFIDDAILMPHPTMPDTYNLTAVGFRKLKLFAGFLATYFESYLVVLKYFETDTRKKPRESKDRLKKIETLGNRMYRKEEIERKEALSKVNYKNGVSFCTNLGIAGPKDREKIDHYTEAIRKYLKYIGG